jgi:hypothetical protein
MSQIVMPNGQPTSKQVSIDGNALIEGFFDKLLQGLMIRSFIAMNAREDALEEIDKLYKANETAFDSSLSFLKAQNLGAFMQIKEAIKNSYALFIKQINEAYDREEGVVVEESIPSNDVVDDTEKADEKVHEE